LGGVVSIGGIGTLALFSGVITVGFLEQIKTSRENYTPVPIGMPADDKPFREIEYVNRLPTRDP
jgi:hypothetical protein